MFGPRTLKTILKLKKVFMLGYCPERKGESYTFVNPYSKAGYYEHINCFAHACFNLTNQQITENCLDKIDALSFRNLIEDFFESDSSIATRLKNFIRKTGLEIEECSDEEELAENQWRVALYFCNGFFFRDFHFILNEKDGCWSSKYGNENVLEFFETRPDKYIAEKYNDSYKYYRSYKITNPYAGKNKKPLDEVAKKLIIKHQQKCKSILTRKQVAPELTCELKAN